MKICALISSHSPSFFTEMTVKTLIRETKGHHLNIHVGFHSNLCDYTNDFSMFEKLRGLCQFHAVDEIDWAKHNEDIYRYSRMHCKNLENLFKNVRYYDFDYVLVLDNDLYFKKDFISELLTQYPNSDIIGSHFDDREENQTTIDNYGNSITFYPKISVWNMMISRRLYDFILSDTSIIYPQFKDGLFYDSFAFVEKVATEFSKGIIKTNEINELVEHFFGSSFNYGVIMNKTNHDRPKMIYEKEFNT
jgi:hypothetical protein